VNIPANFKNKFLITVAALILLLGVYFRFYHIIDHQFIYYDEGMWLVQNHEFVEFIESARNQGVGMQVKLWEIAFHLSLRTGKALWALISYSRGFFVGAEGFAFTRLVSAVLGVLTILLCTYFAKRFYLSTATGILSGVILSVLPSHVYYSRLALQESFSAFFFLAGIYFYLFPRKLSVRTFIASLFFSFVYFVNYRMIIIPVFVIFSEIYLSMTEGRKPDIRKWVYHSLLFFMIVFGVGAVDNGANTYVTFGWMFHQSHLAKGTFDFINLFSFPYYFFKLEGFIFGLLFFGNIILLIKKKWKEAFPFMLVMVFMAIFSLPQEKGVRYLASALPLMATAVAFLICHLYEDKIFRFTKTFMPVLCLFLITGQVWESFQISRLKNDYSNSIVEIKKIDPNSKFISTQSLVQKLYVDNHADVVEFKYSLPYLISLYSKGYKYLIIDPQAYISFTDDQKRFSPRLKGYLQFIRTNVPAIKKYPHFNDRLLTRFVLEHNENLRQSLAFLKSNKNQNFGYLNVYDLKLCLTYIRQGIEMAQKRNEPGQEPK